MKNYPKTAVKPIKEVVHGQKLTDNYRWLEDSDNKEVKKWFKQQNEFTDSALDKVGYNDIFSRELKDLMKATSVGSPHPVKGKYFWEERKPNEEQYALYWRRGLHGAPVVIYNPNGQGVGGTLSIDYWNNSPRGKYIAFGISDGGGEVSTMHIKEVESGKELETIPYTRYASTLWLPDESGFYYTRLPKPGTVPKQEEQYHSRAYFHLLGTNYEQDPVIFGEGREKEDSFGMSISEDGAYLLISVSRNWTENEVFLYNTHTKKLKTIVTGIKSNFSIQQVKGKWYAHTNYKANNFRMLVGDLANLPDSVDELDEFIPEKENVLEGVGFTNNRVLAEYMVNACSQVTVYDLEGGEIGQLPLPPLCSLTGITSRREEDEFFFGVSDFLTTKTTYRYNPEKDDYEVYRKPDHTLSAKDFVVKQEWYESNDGTKVPMFIIHKTGLKMNGLNPTVLYGYGGYKSILSPGFPLFWVPMLERGAVYVIANIRGGGEFGDDWHKSAILNHKQRSFDDFIAAGEYLIDQKYTSPEKLGIVGASNGGLLVGACLVQRPDLFKAAACQVPLLDMVRFPKFLIASRWVHEYGNPEIKKEFGWIIKWSPYHNIKNSVKYPNVLFVTGENDSRVHPMHAWKMTALMQAHSQDNVVLLRTESQSGHGPGKSKSKAIETQADVLTFLAWQLGVKV